MSDFSPGLEGVLAARTMISMVDGQNGRLVYRGYVIADLAEDMSYEEVAYLLWYGQLPTRSQLQEIADKLRAKRHLNSAAEAALKGLAADTHPMDVLRTVVSAQGATAHLAKPDIEQAIANVAAFPTILAAFHRQRKGKEWLAPRADLDHAANYLYMLTGEEPSAERVHALNSYLVLLADHGMNASTFTARVIASTDSDIVSSLVGAIGALKGPAHGGAPSLVMEQLEKIGGPENAEGWGREALERKERLMGFGHRVYRTYDPRAKILKAMAEKLNPSFYALASKWEEVALRLLQ
ncbi:MAG TPA: citrate/2-methylcitrate synthase, partial [Solirubrobacterales bacterium]|nr:citrate/2-methylcitrate synthase [Solirubrobacterales bacterium]